MFGLFGRDEKVVLDDPVFGRIEYDMGKGVELWCHIPTEETDHMVTVQAPAAGPTQAQRDFYESLRRDLASWETQCKAFIAQHKGAPGNLLQMTVYSMELGSEAELSAGQFAIELSDDQAEEIHRVEFRERKPVSYGVDH